ncbi:MAG: Gfo/Idh/MocA family oxidoreductase [Pseudobacteriovorax sp.]|nr:Gfo/Idh/MocA family oxidoreductase [Pseudobacteriovorax sp.]
MIHNDPIQVGLIGFGSWGKVYERVIRSHPKVSLRYLATSQKPELLGPQIQNATTITNDWQELVADPSLHGVVIATPPSTHGKILEQCLKIKKPVIVEKPLTLDVRESQNLLALSKETKSPVLVNHIHLFHSGFRKLKQLLEHIGPIESIESFGGSIGPFRKDYSALWDYGPHDLSLVLSCLKQTPDRVTASIDRKIQDCHSMAENYTVELSFGEVQATIHCGNGFPYKQRNFIVKGRDGTIELNDCLSEKLKLDGKVVPIDSLSPMENLFDSWVRLIQGELISEEGLQLAHDITLLLDKAHKNAISH